jgi:hypothetical protein
VRDGRVQRAATKKAATQRRARATREAEVAAIAPTRMRAGLLIYTTILQTQTLWSAKRVTRSIHSRIANANLDRTSAKNDPAHQPANQNPYRQVTIAARPLRDLISLLFSAPSSAIESLAIESFATSAQTRSKTSSQRGTRSGERQGRKKALLCSQIPCSENNDRESSGRGRRRRGERTVSQPAARLL